METKINEKYITVKIELSIHKKLKAIGAINGLGIQEFVNKMLKTWIEENIEKNIKNFEKEMKK